ncbi:CheY-like chemotaxis protein [Pedobacter cryoconitis]|uniref:CheY-like chemotaxis protein n=1 Tax=Pedobacter cryoconitis TaxID=188932 RepID=A0A7W8ZIT7_9SPHI|nr:response regulator [Pedobacter cryoconitis]MBB5634620.1 CheY-like chemotaxis protein [Pedobacter cryoconitis]MBB6272250.1 CheY-like chemotaxis protein [Pedobacter cryoconitis]
MPNKLERPLKVMLVDDNIIDLKINSKIIFISKLFDEIIQCQSGEEALSYFNTHSNQLDKLPNLILLDIQMPEMDGFEFLENYKRFPPELKENCVVAMLSSTLDFGDIRKAEANPYVIKLLKKPLYPVHLEELFKANFLIVG